MTLPETTTPAELAQRMGWSEDRVKRLAKQLGACRILGGRMRFLPEDVAVVLEAMPGRKVIPEPTPPRRKESVVYFVAVRGFVKIGWTTDWPKRLASLQGANPEKLEILLILGRPAIYEKTLHTTFAEHRGNGEWFKDCHEIRAFIEKHKHECWAQAERFK
jgi:hypothetical protein